jgi:hypothetical protein
MVFSRQSFSARIASDEGRAACFATVQRGTLFWSSSSEAEKDFAWIMVINGTPLRNCNVLLEQKKHEIKR